MMREIQAMSGVSLSCVQPKMDFVRQSTAQLTGNVQLQGRDFCINKINPFCLIDFCGNSLVLEKEN